MENLSGGQRSAYLKEGKSEKQFP